MLADMNCVVTAGPTYEPLDAVRRLTNFSTGRLGTELANHLVDHGHRVTLLLGEPATWGGERRAQRVLRFTTTADLCERLRNLAREPVDAVFHAAAVSDFAFGRVFERAADGALVELKAGKVSSRTRGLLAELVATPKVIAELRGWFSQAVLVGWKYEVDGQREGAIATGARQVIEHGTNACVVNGPAYGPGFGLVSGSNRSVHLADAPALYAALIGLLRGGS
jgi:phosphopantothenoylcysteine decarboxylase/phosphopantothenate--cysteine ligase